MTRKSRKARQKAQPAQLTLSVSGQPTVVAPTEKAKSRKRRSKAAKRSSVPSKIVQQICALTDPFCHHADGVKWWDMANGKTMAYTFRDRATLAGGATTGNGDLCVSAGMKYLYYSCVADQAANIVPSGGYATNLPSGVARYRTVGVAFRVSVVSPLLTRKGMLRIKLFSNNPALSGSIPRTTYNADYSYNIPLVDVNEPINVVLRPTAVEATQFTEPATTQPSTAFTAMLPMGWQFATVSVDGAVVSETQLEIEFIARYEFVFDESDSMQQLATATNPPNAFLSSVVAKVQDAVEPVYKGAATAFSDYIQRAAIGMASTAAANALQYAAPALMLM